MNDAKAKPNHTASGKGEKEEVIPCSDSTIT